MGCGLVIPRQIGACLACGSARFPFRWCLVGDASRFAAPPSRGGSGPHRRQPGIRRQLVLFVDAAIGVSKQVNRLVSAPLCLKMWTAMFGNRKLSKPEVEQLPFCSWLSPWKGPLRPPLVKADNAAALGGPGAVNATFRLVGTPKSQQKGPIVGCASKGDGDDGRCQRAS